MLGAKFATRTAPAKKSGNFRYATRLLALDKGKSSKQGKETASLKACESLLKSEGWKGTKHAQSSKFPVKKVNGNKNSVAKDVKSSKPTPTNRHEKVVIVSKRSSSVSFVKSNNMRRSVSVRKVSYSTSVVLSSEEEDSDSDEDSEDEKEEDYTRRRRTVVKRTTSRIKSSDFTDPKSSDSRSTKKAKAIKMLREKITPKKGKSNPPARELRPRFPYTSAQEWPTARTHRMASLNALAKVHVLYENEGRNVSEGGNDGEDICVIDLLNDDDSEDEKVVVKREARSPVNLKSKTEKGKNKTTKEKSDKSSEKTAEPKAVKKTRKRKLAGDVEIIDTKNCKRMACLNAQAILAASYLQEKPKKLPKKIEKCESLSDVDIKEVLFETKCDINILSEEKRLTSHVESTSHKNINSKSFEEVKKEKKKTELTSSQVSLKIPSVKLSSQNKDTKPSSPSVLKEKSSTIKDNVKSNMLTTTASKVTQYTEITKVQINTRKEVEIKEEAKPEKQVQESDDVAITQMYHYQSKNVNESYSLQMQATYKPSSKNIQSSSSIITPSNQIPPNVKNCTQSGKQNFYSNSSRNPAVSSKSYANQSVNRIPSVIGMDHQLPRQYGGSAFTVPRYGHPQHMRYPHDNYGYYQPAGPLIQPLHDQCTIHKPVPYHPQPHLQQPQIPQPPAPTPNMDRYPPLNDNRPKKSTPCPAVPPAHVANSPQQPIHLPQGSIPVLSGRTSAHSRLPVVDCNQSQSTNMHSSKKPHPSTDLGPPAYSPQNKMREYIPHIPSSQGYPKSYDQKMYSSKQHQEPPGAYNTYHREEKHCNNPNSPMVLQDPVHHLDIASPKHSPMMMHPMFVTHPEMPLKKPLWQDPSKQEEAPSSVMYNTYINEPINKEPLLLKEPENLSYPVRPPSVVEITEESSRDTKTYIQLEVPQNRFREKIVVVDVESDECLNRDEGIQSIRVDNFLNNNQEKMCTDSELKETEVAAKNDLPMQENYFLNKLEENSKECPDIMVIEVKKRKKSALVRRAMLNGKQRTFRDCYNRPLAPLIKTKKTDDNLQDQIETQNQVQTQILQPTISLPRLILPKQFERKFYHGWSWEGSPFEKLVFLSNEEPPCIRQCYSSIQHNEGDIIKVRDCVLLRSGIRKTDLPFVAKVTALWENPDDGEMTMSLLWYYRPEHTEQGKRSNHMDDEIFASKHKDVNSVACIEDKCYVMTFGEYCRHRRQIRLNENCSQMSIPVVPEPDEYPRKSLLPPMNTSADRVFFCRSVYDYRQRRLLKNPT